MADIRLQAAILRPHNDSLDRGIVSLFLVDAPEKEEGGEGEEGMGSEGEESRPKKTRKVMRSREEEMQAQDDQTRKLLKSREEGDARDGQVQDLADSDPFEVHYDEEDQRVHMNHVRDYEPHDESNRKDQEIVFTFIDSQDSKSQGHLPPVAQFEQSFRNRIVTISNGASNGTAPTTSRKNVVYYHPVTTRASLRVRRKRVSAVTTEATTLHPDSCTCDLLSRRQTIPVRWITGMLSLSASDRCRCTRRLKGCMSASWSTTLLARSYPNDLNCHRR